MTAKKLAEKYGVKVMRFEQPSTTDLHGKRISRSYWYAIRGGAGEPVVDIAKAYTLKTLAVRVERALSKPVGKPPVEIL